jgi:hypothetical protein
MFAITGSVVGYRKGGKSMKPLLEFIITRREGGLKSCARVLIELNRSYADQR